MLPVLWLAIAGAALWALVRLIDEAGGPDAIVAAAARVDGAHWAALLPMTLAFYSLDWLRAATLLAILGHRLSWRLGLELAAVGYFVTCLTPTSELYVPAMVLWLVRRGVPLGAATAVGLAKSVYMLFWVLVTGLIGVGLHAGPVVPRGLGAPLAIAFVVPLALVVGLGLAMAFPAGVHAWCERRLARPSLAGWRRGLVRGLDDTVRALATIGRSRSASHLAAHAACFGFIGCYLLLGWLCADGVGIRLPAARAATTFSGSLLVSYIAPTPGGAGATEGATAFLLDPSLPAEATTAALLLRTLCTYAIAPVGLLLVAREAHRMGWHDFARRLRGRPAETPAAGGGTGGTLEG
jgi:uncharacterized protein (TIRG00374 family)